MCICIVFYILVFWNLRDEPKGPVSHYEPISVIISARNEAENLKRRLPKILEQDYPIFEVILVNHTEDPKTRELAESFQLEYDHLRIIHLSINEAPTKKHALSRGIESSTFDFLVFTDADCKPNSNQWLKKSVEYIDGNDILLGYGKYEKRKSILNELIRFDTFQSALFYFLLGKLGWAYMGVGRNLAYRKELYYKVGGYQSHVSVLSGDDDLFIQESANKGKLSICLNPDHHTISDTAQSHRQFFIQKRRHQSAGIHYKPKFLLVLFMMSLAFFGSWMFFLLGILILDDLTILVILFISKLLIQYFCYWKISRTLGEKDLLIKAPFLEIIVVIYNGLVGLSLLISKQTKWK